MGEKRRAVRENLVRGVRLAWDASPRSLIAMTVFATVTALLAPIVIWLGKQLVDQIVARAGQGGGIGDLMPTIVAFGLVGGADRALGIIRFYQQELYSRRVERHAMQRFVAKAATVDLGHFDNSDWHDRMARARRDVGWRPGQLTFTLIGLVATTVSIVGMLGLLASLHPLLVALSVVSLVPWVAIQRRTNRKIYEFHFSHTTEDRERWYMVDLLAGTEGAKELRSFGLMAHFLDRYDRIAGEHEAKLARLYRRGSLAASLAGIGTGVALAIAYGFVAARGLAGELTAGDLTAAIGAFAAVTAQASMLSSSLLQLEQHATFLDDLFAFFAVEPLVRVPDSPRVLPTTLSPGIAMRGVEFTYPRGSKSVLAGIDLEVRPGELIALVGENGAGKTTIVNLLNRFYDPTAGSVSIGGVDLRDVDPAELRARIGVLFQDFAKYQFTLRDNVHLGRVEREPTDPDVLAALDAGRARPLVDSLKQGLESRLGRLFDGGHELSGGEWQRLAVSRLIFRSADIWILDEPTSNLDPEAEAKIFAELKQQLAGRMAIVISHRFSTVRVADRIYVLEHGKVAETGTHAELVAAGGRYAELFEIQAAGYR
ncbi:MAG TPA: ABC transporter ATP-binding protein [Kofleriaceae bacterium]|nr:ABC transporter ATP-binding protein [Kofleriaceae bacterium]